MSEPTPEMISLFYRRTYRHIERVSDNLMSLVGFHGLTRWDLGARASHHDRSKLDDSERPGYIWLNWVYHCRKNGRVFEPSPEIRGVIRHAMAIHRSRNLHHPEAHGDASQMGTLDIVEMVCDWHAIAQENESGPGSTARWAREEGARRWSLTKSQLVLAFEAIGALEKREG